jgi:hypothetical protein
MLGSVQRPADTFPAQERFRLRGEHQMFNA